MERAKYGETFRRDVDLIRKDGSVFMAELTGVPVNGEADSVHLFIIVTDVTWRREAEELGQLRRNFRVLFEHNPAVVLALDVDLRIADVNPAGVRVSGFPQEAMIGRNAAEFVPPTQHERLRAFTSQALRGETVTFPLDAYDSSGRVIQYEATALPIVSNNGIVGVYGLLENVTERMRAERTVAAQREEIIDLEHDFRSLFDKNPEAMVLLSTDGIILDLNEALLRVSGRLREQILGQNFRIFLQGSHLERATAYFRRAVEGEPVQYEVTSTRADGSDLPLDVTLIPKYAQGLAVGVYCVMQDITDRKIAQRRLEMQAQRIRDLYLLATSPEHSDAQVVATLQTGCRLLAMESGAIVDLSGSRR